MKGLVNDMNQRGKAFYNDLEVRYGSKVALFMYNRPEFISNWYGTINCGATPAFINNNLRKSSNNRKHSLRSQSVKPKVQSLIDLKNLGYSA